MTAFELYLFQQDTIRATGARLHVRRDPSTFTPFWVMADRPPAKRISPTEECNGDVR